MAVEIIGEAGISHLGSIKVARQLADHALVAGVGTCKFQTFVPSKLFRQGDPAAPELEQYALSYSDFKILAKHCEDIGIEFMSTPGDVDSLKFLIEECGVQRIKIGSDDLTYKPLVNAAFATRKPVLLSTGMATLAEIVDAIPTDNDWFDEDKIDLTLMHCTSLYPCPPDKVNLRAIRTLQAYGYPVGFSDHTFLFTAACLAVALGATVIEKHFCPNNGYEGPDKEVSLSPIELKAFVKAIKVHEILLGDGIKQPCEQELKNAKDWRKGIDGLRG